jgi:hypothetical protein
VVSVFAGRAFAGSPFDIVVDQVGLTHSVETTVATTIASNEVGSGYQFQVRLLKHRVEPLIALIHLTTDHLRTLQVTVRCPCSAHIVVLLLQAQWLADDRKMQREVRSLKVAFATTVRFLLILVWQSREGYFPCAKTQISDVFALLLRAPAPASTQQFDLPRHLGLLSCPFCSEP